MQFEKQPLKTKILILGGSGFIGHPIFMELQSYFEVYATYCHSIADFSENNVFYRYCCEEDHVSNLLETLQPTHIISAFRGDYNAQFAAHQQLCTYVQNNHFSKLLFLSSAHVFDGRHTLPSYENDKPLAESNFGKCKIAIERLLLEQIPAQTTILRLPMVLGIHSPRIIQLRESIKHQATFEVYPNLSISVTIADKIAQQIHFIISKQLDGIFHLASTDMIHHEELFREITTKMGAKIPIFKKVYRSNDDGYLAILPKKNLLPEQYQITVADVIASCTLNEEILTFKTSL